MRHVELKQKPRTRIAKDVQAFALRLKQALQFRDCGVDTSDHLSLHLEVCSLKICWECSILRVQEQHSAGVPIFLCSCGNFGASIDGLLASERRKSDRPKLEARSTFMHDQEYSLRDWRAESSAQSKRQCREDAARSRADASVQGEGRSLSALGRAFALQETRNELRGLKVY